ncbi:hypothetical protein ACFVXG_11915 [Kitasatospora sp. NPDC058162]|uniref:hypothetical protein n=1 Tax=Kitasatospora sp. NPDC058162 TaxID=3346362 RepID=UPI0036DB97FF
MPKYTIPVDHITVHVVTVSAATPEAAQAEAGRLVAADWETHFHHTVDPVVGDAFTQDEWAAQKAEWAAMKTTAERREREVHPTSPPTRQPGRNVPSLRYRAPRTDHHADDSECPPTHKHTSSGRPLTEGCPGRAYSTAACTCGWATRSTTKGYVDESRKRHVGEHR